MPDYKIAADDKSNKAVSMNSAEAKERLPEGIHGIAVNVSGLLDQIDWIIYAVVGISFVLGGLLALFYSFWELAISMSHLPNQDQTAFFATSIIEFISNLLFVLIIMEVLGTIIEYLKTHTNLVSPFLFIGIISATRGILSIGARVTIEKINLGSSEFYSSMLELGVNAATILALGITLRLLGETKKK